MNSRTQLDSEQLAAAIGPFLELLADRLADQLTQRLTTLANAPQQQPPPGRRLLSLDELVAQLPPAKQPQTWRRWLYQRTRHEQVPGQLKIGGRLFFDRDLTLPWLENGCTNRTLELPASESLHKTAMRDPNRRRRR